MPSTTFEMICGFDKSVVSSISGILQAVALVTGGGVFGIIARNIAAFSASSDTGAIADAVLWYSVAVWVISLLIYLGQIYGNQCLHEKGLTIISYVIGFLYLGMSILWALYQVWPETTRNNSSYYYYGSTTFKKGKECVVFVLATVTSICYIAHAILLSVTTGCCSCCGTTSS